MINIHVVIIVLRWSNGYFSKRAVFWCFDLSFKEELDKISKRSV